jgi:hypothetical protein
VEIKKVANETFNAFWTSLPSGLGLAKGAVRQAWAIQHYYSIVKAVMELSQQETSDVLADEVFTPEVFPAELPINQREYACDLLGRVSSQEAVEIKKLANETFQGIWNSLPSELGLKESAVRKAWAIEHYYDTVKAVMMLSQQDTGELHASAQGRFEPAVLVASLPTEEQEAAQSLLDRIPLELATCVAEQLESACQLSCSQLPAASGISHEHLRNVWLKQHYYKEMARVLTTLDTEHKDFVFSPRVPLDNLEDALMRDLALELVPRVRQNHIALVDRCVEDEYNVYCSKLSPCITNSLSEEVKEGWLRKFYYGIVERVLNTMGSPKKRSQSVRPDVWGASSSSSAVEKEAEAASPLLRRVRRRISGSDEASKSERSLEVRSVGAWHVANCTGSDAKEIQAVVVSKEDAMRKVSMIDKKTQKT